MKGEMITMKWNYNMNSCPIDTRVKLLSENKRNTFEGTIILSHDGKYKVKGNVFVGDGDYFYKLGIIAWKECNTIEQLPKGKIVEYDIRGGSNDTILSKIHKIEPTELSDVIDKLNEVIRKINKEGE